MQSQKQNLLSAGLFLFFIAAAQAWNHQSFVTAPFNPPVFNVTKSGEALAPGYILLTTTGDPNPASVIMTDEGELVWSSPTGPYTNLQIATVGSQQVLAFWNGTDSPPVATTGHGWGNVQMLDTTYKQVYNVCPRVNVFAPLGKSYPCQGDLHESYITDHGTIIISAYNATPYDLTPVGGPSDGYVLDGLFFEIDIETQDVLFSWSALASGIPVNNTFQELGPGTAGNPFDYFHINSIQSLDDGYLVNSRHMWSTYKINKTGDIVWQLQGSTGGDFTLPPGVNFEWEHHARAVDGNSTSLTMTMFNNANSIPPIDGVNQTIGWEFYLDLEDMTVTILQNLTDPDQTMYSESQGSTTLLPNGNYLMGYGELPFIKEYGPDGDIRLTIQFADPNADSSSYRAYRMEWDAVPAADPVTVATNGTIYMSWNGATGVESWDILEGSTNSSLQLTNNVPSSGFETSAPINSTTKFVQVVAHTSSLSSNTTRSSLVVTVL